jgi:hypothetical protein
LLFAGIDDTSSLKTTAFASFMIVCDVVEKGKGEWSFVWKVLLSLKELTRLVFYRS